MNPAQRTAVSAFASVRPKNLPDCSAAMANLAKALPADDLAHIGFFKRCGSLHDFAQLQTRAACLLNEPDRPDPVADARATRAKLWAKFQTLPCGEARLNFVLANRGDLEQAACES
jgi:hypothetical protein